MEIICTSPGTLHTGPSVLTCMLEDNSGIGCFRKELSRLAWKPRHRGTSSKSCSSLTPQLLGLQPSGLTTMISLMLASHTLCQGVCSFLICASFLKEIVIIIQGMKRIALQTQRSCLWRKKKDYKHVIRSLSRLVKGQELKNINFTCQLSNDFLKKKMLMRFR